MSKQRSVLSGKWCTCGDGNVEIRAATYPDNVIVFKPRQKCYSFLPVDNTHGNGYTYVVEAEKAAFDGIMPSCPTCTPSDETHYFDVGGAILNGNTVTLSDWFDSTTIALTFMAETDSLVGVADENSNDGAFVGKLNLCYSGDVDANTATRFHRIVTDASS
tara:strand:+ start:283 stop:765 length:483 start_codon:yes stop_codon:yes gene_type:complete